MARLEMNRAARSLAATGMLLSAALALSAAGPARAADTAGAPGEWLTQYSTARVLGMGGAYVATPGDALGALWNPAGLTMLDQNEVQFENAQLFEDTSINGFSLAVPGSWLPSFGLTMVSLHSKDFQRTDEMNNPLGTFSEGETAYLLTLSRAMTPRFAIGANMRLVQQTVESASGSGFGMDLGAVANLPHNLRAGVSLSNLSGPTLTLRDTKETFPMQARGGLSMSLFDGRGTVALQVDHSTGLGTQVHAGTEYWLFPMFGMRAGYADGRGSGGFSYRFGPAYTLDYAASDEALGVTQRIGINYRFGGFFASSKAEPEAFSPTGENPVTRISLNARTKAQADNWKLDIVNKSDTVVRSFGGSGKPPSHIEWDGKDETGLALPDGIYRYRLHVTDHQGRQIDSPEGTVEISTGGPQVKVPVVSTP
ncbi:MAG TPA: PorV/PorQ family protein [Candidatus Eisenbacteria bacterium]|nr:PorV/PorQ family protein [Candidatus Eisenbacteria bacterium]